MALLSQRGVQDKAFYRLLYDELKPFVLALIENEEAVNGLDRCGFPLINRERLIQVRNLVSSPFIQSVNLEELKNKLGIYIHIIIVCVQVVPVFMPKYVVCFLQLPVSQVANCP